VTTNAKDASDAHETKWPAVDVSGRSNGVCEAGIDGNPDPVALPECLEKSSDANEPKRRSHRLPGLRADAPSHIHDGKPEANDIAVTLSDGRRFQRSRVDADATTDIAVIKISTVDLVALPMGDSEYAGSWGLRYHRR